MDDVDGVDGVWRIDRTGQTMPTLSWLQSFWSFVAAFEERPQGVQVRDGRDKRELLHLYEYHS